MATKVKLIADGVITPDQITLTTASAGTNTTAPATTAFVQQEITALVDSSPAALNTLNELAAALGNDENFSTTVNSNIATKLPLAGGTMTGNLVVSTSSPQIQFQTGSSHYNWQIAAQESVNTAFEISSGAQDADATNNTYTPRLVILQSGNVGIGTDSPFSTAKLQIKTGTNKNLAFQTGTTETSGFKINAFNDPGTVNIPLELNGSVLLLKTGEVERMRINSSGYFGLNTDPTSWFFSVDSPALYIASFDGINDNGFLMNSQTTNAALIGYSESTSSYNDIAIRASAGDASALYIKTTGKVGIGTNSPSEALHVYRASGNVAAQIQSGSSGVASLKLQTSAGASLIYAGVGSQQGFMFYANGTSEAMRIKSDGKVGIGTGIPSYLLETYNGDISSLKLISAAGGNAVNALRFRVRNSGNTSQYATLGTVSAETVSGWGGVLTFSTKPTSGSPSESTTERMRIDSSGILLLKKTSTSVNVAGGYIDGGEAIMSISPGANTYLVRNTSTSAYSFYVGGDGQISAVQTSISSLSDERLKKNIKDIDTGLSEVMALKPRKFDWKEGEGSNEKNVTGFVAQEVETVLPNLIGDFKHDDLDDAKSVKMGDMIPTLVKAIQEQQTIIDDLKTRIETLEG